MVRAQDFTLESWQPLCTHPARTYQLARLERETPFAPCGKDGRHFAPRLVNFVEDKNIEAGRALVLPYDFDVEAEINLELELIFYDFPDSGIKIKGIVGL